MIEIWLYADDILIIEADLEIVISAKKFLSAQFNMKDLRVAYVILEIKILYIKR